MLYVLQPPPKKGKKPSKNTNYCEKQTETKTRNRNNKWT